MHMIVTGACTVCLKISCSQKYWQELNLIVEPKIATARILADINLAVWYEILADFNLAVVI